MSTSIDQLNGRLRSYRGQDDDRVSGVIFFPGVVTGRPDTTKSVLSSLRGVLLKTLTGRRKPKRRERRNRRVA